MSLNAFTQVDDEHISQFVKSATRRLAFVGPGLSEEIAAAIGECWLRLGADDVKVILDVDPEVSRMGYGTLAGIKRIQEAALEAGGVLTYEHGLRIGMVVADDRLLLFTPIPLLIEAGSKQSVHLNAVRLDSVPLSILRDIGWGENAVTDQALGIDAVTPQQLQKVEADLHQNPPLKFNVARKVRVFNAQFEFVEFVLKGARLSRRQVPIRSDLMGLARDEKAKRLLKASFRLIDEDGPLAENKVNRLKDRIAELYLIRLSGYGSVVLRSHKERFDYAIRALRRYMRCYQRQLAQKLDAEINANRESLTEALWPAVLRSRPERWNKYLRSNPSEADIRWKLESELSAAFGSAKDVLEEMQVKVLFKGVTYELLNDTKFVEVARKAIPSFVVLHEEYDASKGEQTPDGEQ